MPIITGGAASPAPSSACQRRLAGSRQRRRPHPPISARIRWGWKSPMWSRGCGARCGARPAPPGGTGSCRAGCPCAPGAVVLPGRQPGAGPSQLARLLRLAPSSVATLVHGLRRAGLVSRTGGQRDRRTASLLLTPEGTAIVGSWQEVNEQILQAAITSLGPASRDALDAALPGLCELTGAVDALADDLASSLGAARG